VFATLNELRRRDPRLFSEHTFARLRRELSARKDKAMAAVERDEGWKRLDRDLGALRESVKRWRANHRGFRALGPALRARHRAGRRALQRAEKHQDAESFHEWRKELKALWYELRLLEAGGGIIKRHVAALHRAEAWLGDEHNVEILCAELTRDASICSGPFDIHRLTAAANRFQCELRSKALSIALPIYARRSREYVGVIERAWKMGRRRGARRHKSAA